MKVWTTPELIDRLRVMAGQPYAPALQSFFKHVAKRLDELDAVNREGEESLPGLAVGPKRFKKPTMDEVQCFCLLINVPRGDAEWFWHKCEGCGWKNAGKAIVDWKATIRAWKLAGYLPSQKPSRELSVINPNGTVISGADKMIFQKEYERVENAIRTIKMGQEGLRGLSAADSERLKVMSARRTELRKLLGVSI
jgi:hypothetical protein